jgi:hypothetical protein
MSTAIFRRESFVFRMTGYYPLLPIVAREKLMAMQYGGDLEAAYRAKNAGKAPIVFRPKVVGRGAAGEGTPATGGADADAVDRKALERSAALYHDVMAKAVAIALEQGTSVLIVGPPAYEDVSRQQQMLAQALADRFGQNPAVRFLDLSHAVDMRDTSLTFDKMHLTVPGNGQVAGRLLQPVLDMARRSGSNSGVARTENR